jgi:hypothetical protein
VCHIDFHDLVKDFASKKCRKVRLWCPMHAASVIRPTRS